MKVLYFSQAAQKAGCREEEWDINEPMSLEAFWQEVLRRHSGLADMQKHCCVASGGEFVQEGGQVDPNQEAAVIPPVSGG